MSGWEWWFAFGCLMWVIVIGTHVRRVRRERASEARRARALMADLPEGTEAIDPAELVVGDVIATGGMHARSYAVIERTEDVIVARASTMHGRTFHGREFIVAGNVAYRLPKTFRQVEPRRS